MQKAPLSFGLIKSLVAFALVVCFPLLSSAQVPQTVQETWALFDSRAEPLETEIIRETSEDGIVLRHVRYVVGTFGGKKTRVAAFYAFPQDRKQLPGIVQLHGGGQRAVRIRLGSGPRTVMPRLRLTGANM